MKNIVVVCTERELQDSAKKLAATLDLPFIKENKIDQYQFALIYTREHLALAECSGALGNPFYIDFLHSRSGYRSQHLQHETILKAVGCKKNFKPKILDTTAGFAQDSFILATSGCEVLMLERSQIIAALIENALRRYETARGFSLKLSLEIIDAVEYLKVSPGKIFDVIYLDPMFPERKKSALVKKEMRMLQGLLDTDEDVAALFSLALKHAKKRVVVKRPLSAEHLYDKKPDIQHKGKSVRFDVYLV